MVVMASDKNEADPIPLFVSRYRREYDFFYEVARLVSQRCDAIAAENGIRAIVTFRAKSPDRLEAKLQQRAKDKKYKTEEDIRVDIVDLSGVRIALYFPGDRQKIASLIRATFIVDHEKPFPDKPKASNRRFDGYHAEHYRVRLLGEQLTAAQTRYGDCVVEIQVASVLMHAWSEVEHDLSYKQLSGEISEEEKSILDGINGIVLAGEIFLERLQAAFNVRVSRTGNVFSNQYELAAFLYDQSRASNSTDVSADPTMGRVDVLFRLLQKANLNTPEGVLPLLPVMDGGPDRRPVGDLVIDRLLEVQPHLRHNYFELRRASGGLARTYHLGQDQPSAETMGRFLHKWIILERFFRAYSGLQGIQSKGLWTSSKKIIDNLRLDGQFQFELEVLRRIRNELVHGVNMPGEDLLEAADKDLEMLLDALAQNNDPDVAKALTWANSGEPDQVPLSKGTVGLALMPSTMSL